MGADSIIAAKRGKSTRQLPGIRAQMRARFIPRILKAEPSALLDEAGDNFAPDKILAVMLQNEKSGGHSERSVGIGTIEVAVWDAVAKIAEKPLHRLLAERYNGGKIAEKAFCYVGGGWYAPGKTTDDLLDEMKGKTRVTTILCYPGSLAGTTELRFIDLRDRDALGNYRVKIYG